MRVATTRSSPPLGNARTFEDDRSTGAEAAASPIASEARLRGLGIGLLILALTACGPGDLGRAPDLPSSTDSPAAVHHDVSNPLSSLSSAPASAREVEEEDAAEGAEADEKGTEDGDQVEVTGWGRGLPTVKHKHEQITLPNSASMGRDTVVQSAAATGPSGAAAPAPAGPGSFEGISNGVAGFTVRYAPPDTVGDVGPNHYVQIVNTAMAVYSKTGALLYGPVNTNTLWSGFGGGCQSNNDGDATVRYDRAAGRWVISQFSVTTTPYLQCVAVSTTGDPLGTYYRYAFSYSNFPDYPKLGVWPDAYYTTFNMFSGNTFAGGKVCAYDRASMLAGQAATQQCFDTGTAYGGLLPSDLDGATPPPAGAPNYVINFTSNKLNLWKLHVDWANPASSTFTGPVSIAGVAPFTSACSNGSGGACVPQPSTTQKLDTLGDRLMYRFAYRNFGAYEALVVNHTVWTGSRNGVRWYEIRSPSASPAVYQQGTYSPDSTHRWMGSVAMDANGNIALGYSASSTSVKPSIRYTGRLASDPLGQMQAEATLIAGGGSQTKTLSRWGDYSSMNVDPTDDCTFWFTSEYLTANGTFNWHTRIGSFRFSTCNAAPPAAGEFSIGVSPSSASALQGASASYSVSVTDTSGSMGQVDLSASGLPATVTATFTPPSLGTTGTSALVLAVGSTTAPGTYAFTITGTGATTAIVHSASASLTVQGPNLVANGDFESGALAPWASGGVTAPSIVSGGHSGAWSANLGSTAAPFNGDSWISQSVSVPASGGTLSFWYQPFCPDTLTYDQQQVQIRSAAGATLATVLNVCSNSGTWTQVSYNLASFAGQTVVLWFNVHDDGWPGDQSAMKVDDVKIQ